MSENGETDEEKRVKEVGTRLAAMFGDYVIMVRMKDGNTCFKVSNVAWSFGACSQFIEDVKSAGDCKCGTCEHLEEGEDGRDD